ncbi:helix-turn-helix domain-containing protein [Spirosoma gilvum]
MQTKSKIKTLEEFKEEHYGKRGTSKRDKLEEGFEAFKLGALLQEARLKKGLTQEQLAERCGTNKAYISKIENNVKEVRLSTLQRIVEVGLGGHLNLSVSL